MGELSGIYDSAFIQPVAKVKENLSIFTLNAWAHYRIEFEEPVPPTPASIVNMVTLPGSGITTLAAGGTINKLAVAALQLSNLELAHFRWEPLDNVEGVLWEKSGLLRFNTRGITARVDRNTRQWDPTLSTTTFWILGLNRDMNLEARNPMQRATPAARFIFWGFRYILSSLDNPAWTDIQRKLLAQGDLATVKLLCGPTTWLPAEGQ